MSSAAATSEHPSGYMASVFESRRKMQVNISRCFDTGTHSDLTIICDGREFKVHKVIITQCDYFKRLLEGDFKESSASILELEEDSFTALRALLTFLYKFTYDPRTSVAIEAHIFHIQVYIIADKYGLTELKDFAADRLNKLINACVSNDITDSIAFVLESGPAHDTRLIEILLRGAVKNIGMLLDSDTFKTLLEDYPDFNVQLCRRLATGTSGTMIKTICPECNTEREIDLLSEGTCGYCWSCGEYQQDWGEFEEVDESSVMPDAKSSTKVGGRGWIGTAGRKLG